MLGLVRLLVIGFLVMTVVYLSLWAYSRITRRQKLEAEWQDMLREGRAPVDREGFIAQGMAAYEGGLRRKLLLLVYVVPTTLFVAIVFATNYM